MKSLAILTILTAASQSVQGCALETSISCTITQWGMDYGKPCVDEETLRSNIVGPAIGGNCRNVAVELKYKICKGDNFNQKFKLNSKNTWGRLRGDDVGLTLSSIPEDAVCVSALIYTQINTCDERTASGLNAVATTPDRSKCKSYTFNPIIPIENNVPVQPQQCELETSISCTIKDGDNVDKPCKGNIFYNDINPTICVPISVEFKYEICKGNAAQETIPYYFNKKRTSASLRVSGEIGRPIKIDTSPLSEMCRSEIVYTTISACQGPVIAFMDARAQIGNNNPVCNGSFRLDIIPREVR